MVCRSAQIDMIFTENNIGMFLWVRLVISMLENAYSIKEMQEILDNLPEGLDKVSVPKLFNFLC